MSLVLIVEDDPDIAEMLRDFFESRGYQADVETDGALALEHVQRARPDAIVLDLMMPVVNGVETARRLRRDRETRDIPIVAISAIDETDEFADVLMVDALFQKPFDLERIGERVHQLLLAVPQDASNGPAAYL